MPEMKLTARGLNRSTLARKMLLRRESLGVSKAVLRLVALQAQEPASPYLALWNRLTSFDPSDLDAAFSDGMIVKSNAVRMTLHATHADDFPAFREATEPSIRAARLRDARFKASGLTEEQADGLVPELLAVASQPITTETMSVWLAERLGDAAHPGAWWGLRQYAPLLRPPTGGPWSFTSKTSYVAPSTTPRLADPHISNEFLTTLVLCYLAAFGPATVADVAVFALVQRSRINIALKAITNDLERLEGPNGETLFDIPGAPRADEDTPAPPRLLGMWDNVLLAYYDRSRIIPPDYRKTVIRINGDVLPTLLVDGYVAGVWRAVEAGIEATAFHPLPDDIWHALAAEARSLAHLLAERDPLVYRRYTHWWAKLPSGTTRLLPGE